MSILIEKPKTTDIEKISEIISFWTEREEVDKYIERIKSEIGGLIEYNLQFWVAKNGNHPVGIVGLCNPLPKILPFAKTKKPGELKILYLDKETRGKGIGRQLVDFFEEEARKQGYQEILIRSAKKYEDTAYGFYEKMRYKKVGQVFGGTDPAPMQVFEKEL
jgi:GNAT superfamily N-acetyltransferase